MVSFMLIIAVFLLLSNMYAAYDSYKDGNVLMMYLCFVGISASFSLVVTNIVRMAQGA